MHILLVNMSALILGTVIGCLLKKYVPEKLQENSMIYFSIVTLVLGIRLIERTTSFSAVVIAFLIGGTIGWRLCRRSWRAVDPGSMRER